MQKNERLQRMIDLFLACMSAARGSDEQLRYGREFNRAFDDPGQDPPGETVSGFASRISALGIPYEQAFADLVYVRGMGRGEDPDESTRSEP